MRLIDADAVIADVKKNNQTNFDKQDWTSRNVCTLLIGAPTIDAVEVVRCSQCKHRMHLEGATDVAWECALRYGLPGVIAEEDYCSYGERKEADHG